MRNSIQNLYKAVFTPQTERTTILRNVFRLVLGTFLLIAGISHLTINREAFLAQVPTWLPLDGDFDEAQG